MSTVIENMMDRLDAADQEKVISYIEFLTERSRASAKPQGRKNAYGMARGQKFYVDGFDIIHDGDDEIAALFGV